MSNNISFEIFLSSHKQQLLSSNIPEIYWKSLYLKLTNHTFNVGKIVQMVKLDYDEEPRKFHEPIWAIQTLTEINKNQTEHIYLIDHAWTYRVKDARKQLKQCEALRNRLANIFNIDVNLYGVEELVEIIFDESWRVNNFYSIHNSDNAEDRLPIWYIMDEIGCAILHDDNPNCRLVPFIYLDEQVTYSLLFPIKDIPQGELLLRNYVPNMLDSLKRDSMLLPWCPKSFLNISIIPDLPGPEYFLKGHVEESLPTICDKTDKLIPIKDKYKVYSQYQLIKQYLNDSKFEFVDNEDDADILWYVEHFKNFAHLSEEPEKFINQFPFEFVLTVKDLLYITCRRLQSDPIWLPQTYNLLTELPNFISCYQRRSEENLDNYWIVKPFNLARGLDIHITNNLNYIIRLSETGPKIVQKYITDPVLFYRPDCLCKVKFDLRYVVLLKNVNPLEVYAYKNFFVRFANKEFHLNDFDDYEKHFTVMNYTENAKLKHMLCEEFINEWEQQYPDFKWNDVEISIFNMLKTIFQCAIQEKPPCGIGENPQSRALYAADIMLKMDNEKIVPVILEFNFTPDCKRACEYYQDFYNDIFGLLFLNRKSNVFYKM